MKGRSAITFLSPDTFVRGAKRRRADVRAMS